MPPNDIESTSLLAAWHGLATTRQEISKPIANGQLLLSTDSKGNEWRVTFQGTGCKGIEKMAAGMLHLEVCNLSRGTNEASVLVTFDRVKGGDCIPLWVAMVEELAKATLSASGPRKRGKVLKNTLEQWADWWPRNEALSKERKIGLVGELTFLEYLAQAQGPQLAVNAWNGPDGDNQDFCVGRTAFEVKCHNKKGIVEISNLEQLNDVPFAALYLIAFRCSDTGNHQMSLQERCDSIIRHIGSNAALDSRFTRALAKAGWFRTTNVQREEKHEVKFTAYHVRAGFPRILECSPPLPRGVILKPYKIDLQDCATYKIGDSEFNSMVKALAKA